MVDESSETACMRIDDIIATSIIKEGIGMQVIRNKEMIIIFSDQSISVGHRITRRVEFNFLMDQLLVVDHNK